MRTELDSSYKISDQTKVLLGDYVIHRVPPARILRPIDFSYCKMLDSKVLKSALAQEPNPISLEKMVGITLLAYKTEAPTPIYSGEYRESALKYDARWMGSLIDRKWEPEEFGHADRFKRILLIAGFSEWELDKIAKETQEAIYEHSSGKTPVDLTTFGGLQEYFTVNYYRLMYPQLMKISPESAQEVREVMGQEAGHEGIFTHVTAIQIADNPSLIHNFVDTVTRFEMPGKLSPELQGKEFMRAMGVDFRRMEKEILRWVAGSVNHNPEALGQAVIEFISKKASGMTSIPAKTAEGISNLPFVGKGINLLVGQAVQEREGIDPHHDRRPDFERRYWKATTLMRSLMTKGVEHFLKPYLPGANTAAA